VRDDPRDRAGVAGPLDQWYQRAGVRTGVRRMFDDETRQGKVFFPAALVPHLTHEAVRELPPERHRELAVRHLYQFLLSATHLETRIVNRAAELIANNRAGLQLPAAARLDAFKIYCDEGYHALYSLDLADQIAASTGIAIPRGDYGGLVDGLVDAGRRLLPDEPRLAALLQAVVFETLITAVLNELPADGSVVSTVRDVMRDHARDEGRHHRFFASFLHELWAQLGSGLRPRVARLLPVLIRGCLDWDTAPVRSALRLAGLPADVAQLVVADCYGGADLDRVRDICQATVRICASAGVLDVPGAAEEFAAHGLTGVRTGG
jgi:P-aminobenzoate N-oxygenase AurF